MFNVCFCGSAAGYPHTEHCPFPFFGHPDSPEAARWYEEHKARKQHKAAPARFTQLNQDAPLFSSVLQRELF